jgi:hypothetical protein
MSNSATDHPRPGNDTDHPCITRSGCRLVSWQLMMVRDNCGLRLGDGASRWSHHCSARCRTSASSPTPSCSPRFASDSPSPCGEPQSRGRMSDSGSEMGAEGHWQTLSKAAHVPAQDRLTSADEHKQTERDGVCLADTEEVTGSIPVPPTRSLQVSEHTEQPETSRGATTGATNSIWPASRRWAWPCTVLTGLRVLRCPRERHRPAYAGPSRELPADVPAPRRPSTRPAGHLIGDRAARITDLGAGYYSTRTTDARPVPGSVRSNGSTLA